jgi:hypothetical protein
MSAAGIDYDASAALPFSVRRSAPWIGKAIAAPGIGPAPAGGRSVRAEWIEDQKAYHEKAAASAAEKQKRNAAIVRAALAVSVAAYFAALIFELTRGGLHAGAPVMGAAELEYWRTVLKIAVGSASAITIFTANYYDRLALGTVRADHERMAELFSAALRAADKYGEQPQLLRELAAEELAENGRWFSYQSENGPEINI